MKNIPLYRFMDTDVPFPRSTRTVRLAPILARLRDVRERKLPIWRRDLVRWLRRLV
jgi:hypothetical protein